MFEALFLTPILRYLLLHRWGDNEGFSYREFARLWHVGERQKERQIYGGDLILFLFSAGAILNIPFVKEHLCLFIEGQQTVKEQQR